MDTCFWMPLLWVLGASALAGLLGWFWGKRDNAKISSMDTSKDLEIQNLKRDLAQVQEKADNALAGLSRETTELQDRANLWREKFNKLQLQTSGLANSNVDESKLEEALAESKALKDQNSRLVTEVAALKAKAKKTPTKKSRATMSVEKRKAYEKEIKSLKAKLSRSKAKVKKMKSAKSETKEIEITKSIDIETLKKLLDKVPLKKVSERVIRKK